MNPKPDNKIAEQISKSEGVPLEVVQKVLSAFYRLTKQKSHQFNFSHLADAVLIKKSPGKMFNVAALGGKEAVSYKFVPAKIAGKSLAQGFKKPIADEIYVVEGVSAKGFAVKELPTKKTFNIPIADIGKYALLTDLEGDPTIKTPGLEGSAAIITPGEGDTTIKTP